MATTKKKKRSTKHRGNAAGKVEQRGRTGRKLSPAEEKKAARAARRRNRFDLPPTWSGAATRAGVAALLFVVLVILAFGQPVVSSLALGVFVFLFYIPLGYYTDLFFHRRRRAKLQQP